MTRHFGGVRYLTRMDEVGRLSDRERAELAPVVHRFAFRCNDYYLSLVNWDDPHDPIRRIVIPQVCELDGWGRLDPSDERVYTIMPGVEHKYTSTVLLLVSNVCDGICRYCFRKRIFMRPMVEYLRDVPAAMHYIESRPEVVDVLLTGGDPLTLSTLQLAGIIQSVRRIEHVQTIRISTRVPAFNPFRIIHDRGLLDVLEQCSTVRKRVYVMTHFVHPRELTDVAVEAIELLRNTGAVIANQMPLIRGVNDDPQVLTQLVAKLSFIGDAPYYIFQCRPAAGNKAYAVPVEEGCEIVEQAKSQVSGLAKRLRYVMSHSSGKIEIVGRIGTQVCFRYHQAVEHGDSGRLFLLDSNPRAYWLDDYRVAAAPWPARQT